MNSSGARNTWSFPFPAHSGLRRLAARTVRKRRRARARATPSKVSPDAWSGAAAGESPWIVSSAWTPRRTRPVQLSRSRNGYLAPGVSGFWLRDTPPGRRPPTRARRHFRVRALRPRPATLSPTVLAAVFAVGVRRAPDADVVDREFDTPRIAVLPLLCNHPRGCQIREA